MSLAGTAVGNGTGALRLRVESGADGLRRLQGDWDALTASSPDLRFYHTSAWIQCVMDHLLDDPATLHFFALFRDATLVAVVPLQRLRRRLAGLSEHVWMLPQHAHIVLSDYVQRSDEDSAAVLATLLAGLMRGRERRCDVLELPHTPDSGFCVSALRRFAQPRSLMRLHATSMYFDCTSQNACRERISGHFRRNLRRQRKKLEQRGRVEFEIAQDPASVARAFGDFLRLESSGWKGQSGLGTAIALDPSLQAFYSSLRERFGATRACRIALLRLDGAAIAAQFCLLHGRTMNLIKIAYDEALAPDAPGNHLLDEMLDACCAAPDIDRLSLVSGPSWGLRWNPLSENVWNLTLADASILGRLDLTARRLRKLLRERKPLSASETVSAPAE